MAYLSPLRNTSLTFNVDPQGENILGNNIVLLVSALERGEKDSRIAAEALLNSCVLGGIPLHFEPPTCHLFTSSSNEKKEARHGHGKGQNHEKSQFCQIRAATTYLARKLVNRLSTNQVKKVYTFAYTVLLNSDKPRPTAGPFYLRIVIALQYMNAYHKPSMQLKQRK